MSNSDKQKQRVEFLCTICSNTIRVIWLNMLVTFVVTSLPIPLYAQLIIINFGLLFFVYKAYEKCYERYNKFEGPLFVKKSQSIKKDSDVRETVKDKEIK